MSLREMLRSSRLLRPVEDLQAGALLEDGRGHGEWGPLEGPLVRRMPPACCLLFFVVALICFVSAFVFAVIVICFKTGLG